MDFNVKPYYDDYDETKHFYKALFKPGFAVQGRELNQLQEILQKQITRFGNHIFKPGSLVIPGNLRIDKNYNYVKLETTYNSTNININNFADKDIIGQTNGIQAKVVKIEDTDGVDPPTLFLKYLDSGFNNNNSAFVAGETIQTNDGGTTYYATVGSTTPTGKCIAVLIDTGVYYVKDYFVRVESNTIILDKYTSNSSYRVGLEVVESIVNSVDDESLLDPALESSNYLAPGADRYKIELILSKRSLSNTISSDTFIELGRLQDGVVTEITNNRPGYNILADELARRTFDESGDYTVEPFKLKFIEHLRDETNPDGFITLADGGDADYAIAVLSPGKSYVRGYEVETQSNRYLTFEKPRDLANVTNAVVRTQMGTYIEVSNVYTIPNFTSDLITVSLYNQYTSSKGNTSGTLVGTAKCRGFELSSGNVMLTDSIYNVFVFDIQMSAGYKFEKDVKQIYHANVTDGGYSSSPFSADIVPSKTTQNGALNLTTNSNVFVGVNTALTSTLKPNAYIRLLTDASNVYRVVSLTNSSLTTDKVYPLANVTSVSFTVDECEIKEKNKPTYLFPFQYDVVTNVTDITIRTKKMFYSTLSSGNVDLSTSAGTTFASRTDADYFAVVVSGSTNRGKLFRIGSGNFEYTDAPTNRNIRISLGSYGLAAEDVIIYTTLIKTNPTAKIKTVTSGSITLTAKADCESPKISLGKADVFYFSNVFMSANAFGTAYDSSNEVDISDRFILHSGQTGTYYGLSHIETVPGALIPTGPIKVNFQYYAHGSGDFFTPDSYPDYDLLPVFEDQGIQYHLRNYIDFRPRISDAGTNFSGTGSSKNDFLSYADDFICDYQYYLPRKDKIIISAEGKLSYLAGISSLTPVEPQTPSDSMALYIISHPAYSFDVNHDSTFIDVDQRRYTMKDIGKLDSRITNLEYYTQLSLLELDTSIFSVKDSYGLDRYKNGFIVESFNGHGIGDVRNPDYSISMDIDNGILLPSFSQKNVKIKEVATSDVDRTANGYSLINNTAIMLNYEDVVYTSMDLASDSISITPFDVYVYSGVMTLDPPADTWYEETYEPIISKNSDGTWDSMIPDSVGKKIYGSVWGSWKVGMPDPTMELNLRIK